MASDICGELVQLHMQQKAIVTKIESLKATPKEREMLLGAILLFCCAHDFKLSLMFRSSKRADDRTECVYQNFCGLNV